MAGIHEGVEVSDRQRPVHITVPFYKVAAQFRDETLSPRELGVLKLKLIAAELSVSEETVKGHAKNILAKLRASDRTHAVTVGLKRGMIEL